MTFDLKVVTEPEGARISYRRRGEPFQVSSDVSNLTLTYLTKAIWEIQAEKNGCFDSKRFDPMHEPIPSLVLKLKCK